MTDKDLSITLSNDDSNEKFIQVPIKQKDFGEFISNLLGQPESINGYESGSFTINHEQLVNLHHLIEQRIKLQAQSTLVDFSALIRYDDAPERKITTPNGFIHFSETRITTTKSISLVMTYLVLFPGRPSPEKQEITIKFIADSSTIVTSTDSVLERMFDYNGGLALFEISHTERTWGDDISALVDREVKACFKPNNLFQEHIGEIKFISAIIIIGFGLGIPDYIEELLQKKETASMIMQSLPNNASFASLTIDEKLNLIFNVVQPGAQLRKVGIFYRTASLICSVALVAIFSFFIPKQKSHILVTKKDYQEKEKYDKKKSFTILKLIVSSATAVALGIAGNYLYYLLHLPS